MEYSKAGLGFPDRKAVYVHEYLTAAGIILDKKNNFSFWLWLVIKIAQTLKHACVLSGQIHPLSTQLTNGTSQLSDVRAKP